jgi:glyoxylase-like metal-dependent hydrolase (beta-lactamase superfamily II)
VLEFTEGEGEVLPGITVRLVNGHTSALQCPVISDGRATLFYCADLVPTSSHVPLPWIMAYDLRPLVTLEEKRRLLTQAADEGWIMFFEHDPAVAAARLRRTDKGIVLGSPVQIE